MIVAEASVCRVVKLLLSFFVFISLALGITSMSTQSHAQTQSDQQRKAVVLPTVRAATDCIAASAVRMPGVVPQASDGLLSDAIRRVLSSQVCDEAILKMVGTYDRVNGPGTGLAFFSGPYGLDLPRAVRNRLSNRTDIARNGASESSKSPINPSAPTMRGDPNRNVLEGTQAQMSEREARSLVLPRVATSSSGEFNSRSNDVGRPKTTEEVAAERAFKAMFANLAGIVALAGGATFILFLMGLGSRWVVFADQADLTRTATIVLAPIVTGLALAFDIWRLTIANVDADPPLDKAFFLDHPTLIAIIGIGFLVFLWAFVTTFTVSIRYNGAVMGFSIAVLRVVAALFVPLAIFGSWHVYSSTRNRNSLTPSIGVWIILGVFIWFATKLINGGRVMERRQDDSEQIQLQAI